MCKESQLAAECPGCGIKIAFPFEHQQHCQNPRQFNWSSNKKK